MAPGGTQGHIKARGAPSLGPALVNLPWQIHLFSKSVSERESHVNPNIRQQSPEAPKVMKHWYLPFLSVIADIQIMMPIRSLGEEEALWGQLVRLISWRVEKGEETGVGGCGVGVGRGEKMMPEQTCKGRISYLCPRFHERAGFSPTPPGGCGTWNENSHTHN